MLLLYSCFAMLLHISMLGFLTHHRPPPIPCLPAFLICPSSNHISWGAHHQQGVPTMAKLPHFILLLFCVRCLSDAATDELVQRYSVEFMEPTSHLPTEGFPMTLEDGKRYVCELPESNLNAVKPTNDEVSKSMDTNKRLHKVAKVLHKAMSNQASLPMLSFLMPLPQLLYHRLRLWFKRHAV